MNYNTAKARKVAAHIALRVMQEAISAIKQTINTAPLHKRIKCAISVLMGKF